MDNKKKTALNIYTKIEVDLNQCSASTVAELWLYSKRRHKLSNIEKFEKAFKEKIIK